MVVTSHHLSIIICRFTNCYCWKFSYCTIYLLFILISMMNKEKNLETTLTLCIALIVFYFIFHIKLLLSLSIFLGIIGLFFNYLSGKITWLWLKLSQVLGFISSKILLTLIFLVFLFPISLLYRLFNKDSLQLKKGKFSSYFVIKNHEFTSKDLENPW
jgi:hypothetical protein